MNRIEKLSVVAMLAASPALAYYLPDETHAWFSNDRRRPLPPVIELQAGKAPSDAVAVFDGTEKSYLDNWRSYGGKPPRWKFENGILCTQKDCGDGKASGNLVSRDKFGDCQIHFESSCLDLPESYAKAEFIGNSGLYLPNGIEIQVIDSSPAGRMLCDHAYPDGLAGGVYGDSAAMANPIKPHGAWQSYDVVFHPAKLEGDRVVRPGTVTVFINGILVQDHFTFTDMRYGKPRNGEGHISFQHHGGDDLVKLRNIWVRRLPAPETTYAVGGAPLADKAAVKAERARMGALCFAESMRAKHPFEAFTSAVDALGYTPSEATLKRAIETCEKFLAFMKAQDRKGLEEYRIRAEILNWRLDLAIEKGALPKGLQLVADYHAFIKTMQKQLDGK